MKIKISAQLNKMLDELYLIDFFWIDELLSAHADYYTIADKTSAEEGVDAGFDLAIKAIKKNKPVYEVVCKAGNFSVYFIGDSKYVAKILKKALDKAKQGNDND